MDMISNLFTNNFNVNNKNQDNITEGFRNQPEKKISEHTFINSPETPKHSNIKKNRYYISMKNEIKKSQLNIQNINNNKNKSLSKYDKAFKDALIDLFTKNTFMIQQIIKMETLSGKNEEYLQNATEDLKELNNLCENIYGFSSG